MKKFSTALCWGASAFLISSIIISPNSKASETPSADVYPQGTISFIIPATPGGTTDLVARIVAKELAAAWKSNVIVENRAGAGGVIGATYVINSKPNGLTVLVAPSALGVRSGIDRKLPYDSVRDLAGVSLLARTPSFLVVSPSLKVKSPAELKTLIEKSGKDAFYGSAGIGSTGHMHAALFAGKQGIKGTHAPYKGTPEAVNDAVTARITYVFSPGPNALPYAADGRAVILGTTSESGARIASQVLPYTPEVLDDDIGDDWYAAFVPAGTPADIRAKLSKEIGRILAKPEIRQSFAKIGAEPASNSPDELDIMFKNYVAKARDLGEEYKIVLD
ncbi:MAG TPA: tripartite tricarboxylate transporter substrate-binding protein [Eoetvoesiella sp.]